MFNAGGPGDSARGYGGPYDVTSLSLMASFSGRQHLTRLAGSSTIAPGGLVYSESHASAKSRVARDCASARICAG